MSGAKLRILALVHRHLIPPETIPRRISSISSGSVSCPLDATMFQNLFNHLRLTDLAMLHQYTCEYLSWKLALGSRWPPGTVSVTIWPNSRT